ncbi:MAG: sialate O-acetylesterase [Limisphaerales bacterium]
MTNLRSPFALAAVLVTLWSSSPAAQALNLPRIFSDNMVLQRDIPLKIWGWADPGQSVEVSFSTRKADAKAGADGKWIVTLEPLPANAAPGELSVSAADQRVSIKNVLVGEVWICSGQSNMEWALRDTDQARETIAAADFPLIRQFKVPHVTNAKPQKDLPGEWSVCSPATAPNFTGVGYHFGLQLHKKLNVPIGLINTSWGGTRIEPWTDPEGFKLSTELKDISELIANADAVHRQNQIARLDELEAWVKQSRGTLEAGADLSGFPGGIPQHPLNAGDRPTGIYNAMIAPLVPYGMRGAIWYQGESNNGEGMLYLEKMKALIGSWRRLWGQGDFPFLYVQLAPYRYNRPEALPGIWEAQTAALSMANTGMAVITDIGNVADIHPRNKTEVGRRLSLWALAKTYGANVGDYSGPLYRAMQVQGDKAILTFDHAEGLKSLDGKPLTWFTVAGEDKKFVDARAEIAGKTVVVSGDGVAKPAAVRFGWHETAEPNLANGAGLPASPFRTDRWQP